MTTTIYKTSDYLSTDELHRLIRYFKKMGNLRMCLLIEFGVKTLLRYSDLSRIQWIDVIGKDTLILNEKKTGKRREISLGIFIDARKAFDTMTKNTLEIANGFNEYFATVGSKIAQEIFKPDERAEDFVGGVLKYSNFKKFVENPSLSTPQN